MAQSSEQALFTSGAFQALFTSPALRFPPTRGTYNMAQNLPLCYLKLYYMRAWACTTL
jgi:hypothetical protein